MCGHDQILSTDKKGKKMSMEKDSFQHQREGNVKAKVKSTYYSVDSLFQGQIDTSMISYKYKGQKNVHI